MNLIKTLGSSSAVLKALRGITLGIVIAATAIQVAHATQIAGVEFGSSPDFSILNLQQTDPNEVIPEVSQAISDAKAAANFTYGLAYNVNNGVATPKADFTVSNGFTLRTVYAKTLVTQSLTIGSSLTTPGKYAFTLGGIDFGTSTSNNTLTINAPTGSKVVLIISGAFLVNGGSIALSGGITSKDIAYRLVGNANSGNTGVISGNGTVKGTILAPGRDVALLGKAVVKGSVMANAVATSSGAVVSPEF